MNTFEIEADVNRGIVPSEATPVEDSPLTNEGGVGVKDIGLIGSDPDDYRREIKENTALDVPIDESTPSENDGTSTILGVESGRSESEFEAKSSPKYNCSTAESNNPNVDAATSTNAGTVNEDPSVSKTSSLPQTDLTRNNPLSSTPLGVECEENALSEELKVVTRLGTDQSQCLRYAEPTAQKSSGKFPVNQILNRNSPNEKVENTDNGSNRAKYQPDEPDKTQKSMTKENHSINDGGDPSDDAAVLSKISVDAKLNAGSIDVNGFEQHQLPCNATSVGDTPDSAESVSSVVDSVEAANASSEGLPNFPDSSSQIQIDRTPTIPNVDRTVGSIENAIDGSNSAMMSENPISSVASLMSKPNNRVGETQEEEEWMAMGLGLGDALRQIVTLTEERDAAIASNAGNAQAESLLVEFQSRLEVEMDKRAEYEAEVKKMHETLKSYEERLSAYDTMEDELEKAQASLVTIVSEKSKMEIDMEKLREARDELERKEIVLSNRLNEAKKKEANKSTEAGRFEADNEKLKEDLERVTAELDSMSKAKIKLEGNMEKLKSKAVERVKQAETALAEERELNEERKKKMKLFVETKAEELRDAKESATDMQKELRDTRASLRASRDREEILQKDLEVSRIKQRELQRDMERMKRNSEQLHKMGNNLEQELEKSFSETEEHKNKRIAAKHELMTMMRTLEAERAVSLKLRESIKFTFTPKALSQQQLLTECLQDFEVELERMATKMGKVLASPPDSCREGDEGRTDEYRRSSEGDTNSGEINGSSKKSRKNSRASKADLDTERLISNLEQETQHVSKGIMSLIGRIERMRSILNEDHGFGCMSYFSQILAGQGEARHQMLGVDSTQESDQCETVSITTFEQNSTR